MPKPKRPLGRTSASRAPATGTSLKVRDKVTSISITTRRAKRPGSRQQTTVVIKNTVTTTDARRARGGSSSSSNQSSEGSGKTQAKRKRENEEALALTPTKKHQSSQLGTVRAKPFIAKASPDILSRLERALEQRLYLIRYERHNDGLGGRFAVLGNTGNVYEVTLGLSPSCTCVDFIMKRKPCKHLLFVWLRVLKKKTNNPLVWQQALVAREVRATLNPFFSKHVLGANSGGLPRAHKDVLRAFGRTMMRSHTKGRRSRLGDDCPICFERTTADDEKNGLLACCAACGHNAHVECIQLWRKASAKTVLAGTCPVCRQAMGPSGRSTVAPGALLPAPTSRWGVGVGGRGYLNLTEHSAAQTVRKKPSTSDRPSK